MNENTGIRQSFANLSNLHCENTVALIRWSNQAQAAYSPQRALSLRRFSSIPASAHPKQGCCLTSQLISMSEYTWSILQRAQSEG